MALFGPSQFGVTNPFMTKGGDIVFTVYMRFPSFTLSGDTLVFSSYTVDYAITDGTGVLDTDYEVISGQPLTGTLTFTGGALYQTVTLATLVDGSTNETLICTLSNPSGSLIPGEDVGTGTIMEPTNGITYFDFTGGDDANDGSTPALAKKDWEELGFALKNSEPGDAFLFKRGETFDTSIRVQPRSTLGGGGGGNPVIVGAYGDITDPAPIIDSSNASACLKFINEADCVQNVTIQDIRFTSSAAEGSRCGIGIQIGNENSGEIVQDYKVLRVEADHMVSHGIDVDISIDNRIRFCHLHHNFPLPTEGTGSTGIFAHKAQGQHFEYNYLHDNGKPGDNRDWQIYSSHTTDCRTRYNIMQDGPDIDKSRGDVNYHVIGNIMTGGTETGGGLGGDSTDDDNYQISSGCIYAQNYKYGRRLLMSIGEGGGNDPFDPGEVMNGFDVYSNVFHNSGDYEFLGVFSVSDNSSQNVRIFNNLIIVEDQPIAIDIVGEDMLTLQIKNNVLVRVGAATGGMIRVKTSAIAGTDLASNIYYNDSGTSLIEVRDVIDYANLVAWQAAFPAQDVGSIEADPLLVDVDTADYRLTAGSLAINAAIDLTANAPFDFYGNVLTSPYNMGPLEEVLVSEEFQMSGLELETGPEWDEAAWPAGTVIDVSLTVSEDNAPMKTKTKTIEIEVT